MIKRYELKEEHRNDRYEKMLPDDFGEYVLYEDHLKDRQELIEALRDYYDSNCGRPKICGHDFDCICPSDRVKAILSANIEGKDNG